MGPCVAKSVVHLWELGGGSKLSNLLEVTVTMDSVEYVPYVKNNF